VTGPLAAGLAGIWLLPAVVALRLLERPLAGILVGLISGLVVFPYLFTNLWWAFFAELPFLIVLYRFWKTWQYFAAAAFVGLIYPVLAAVSFDLWALTLPVQIGLFVLTMASCVGGTWLGIVIAERLRAAGVAKLARRRPKTVATPRA
jgi:energy-coupling factor transport system permease protein